MLTFIRNTEIFQTGYNIMEENSKELRCKGTFTYDVDTVVGGGGLIYLR